MLVIFSLVSCVRPDDGGQSVPTKGPPSISYDLVRQHAEQFDVDVPDRPPGSQHELAAASYILGHLQLAGFSPRLDRVPVADTINSTNVFAYPPNGSEPEFLVAITYDTPASGRVQQGRELGLFLELARAVTVADPDHSVAFAALGAENADRRGTRRLAQFLLDEGIAPSILLIRFDSRSTEGSFYAQGACAGEARAMAYADSLDPDGCRTTNMHSGALDLAGFQLTYVGGDIEELGRGLFDFLMGNES